MIKCPKCNFVNPEGARICICGLDMAGAFQHMSTEEKLKCYVGPDKDAEMRRIQNSQPVVVTDIDMPFGSMVVFMVKWALASIPAIIILTIIGMVVFGILTGVLTGLSN